MGGRRRVRIGWWLVLLLLLLPVGEGICWLMLKDRSNHYLVSDVIQGRPVWRENPFFMYRFFGERIAETPTPLVATKIKRPDTLRICLLGDSAAHGWPDASAGITRQLAVLLEKMGLPDAEVFNMALHEGNTHVLREVARDLVYLQPDVTIILTGNHEVAGPCGPSAGIGRFHSSSRLARLEILASRLRLVQAFREFMEWLRPAQADDEAWRESEPISLGGRMDPEDPQLRRVHRAFRSNLKAIVREARKHSGQVVLCTVPVNLQDCPPFATALTTDEGLAQQNRERLRAAQLAIAQSNLTEAVSLYEGVVADNPHHAEALWQLATLYARQGQPPAKTLPYFLRARDADALRLRVDSGLNNIIRGLAEALRVTLLDAESSLNHSPGGIPGRTLFWDHVHYTFDGAYEMAKLICDAMEVLPDTPAAFPSAEEVSGQLMYELWGRLHEIRSMQTRLRRFPFLRQSNHTQTMAYLAEARAQTETRLAAFSPAGIRQIYNRRHSQAPQDAWLAMNAARYFIDADMPGDAERAAEAALALWPHRFDVRATLSLVRALQGESPEVGIRRIRGADAYTGYADVAGAMRVAGGLHEKKKYSAAEQWYRFVLERDSWNSEAIIQLSEVLRLLQRYDDAEALLADACKRNPRNPLLWEARGVLHSHWGTWDMATEYFRQSEQVAPERADRLYKWAMVMYRLREYRRAHPIIQSYLAAEPNDPDALELKQKIEEHLPPPEEPEETKPPRRLPW